MFENQKQVAWIGFRNTLNREYWISEARKKWDVLIVDNGIACFEKRRAK